MLCCYVQQFNFSDGSKLLIEMNRLLNRKLFLLSSLMQICMRSAKRRQPTVFQFVPFENKTNQKKSELEKYATKSGTVQFSTKDVIAPRVRAQRDQTIWLLVVEFSSNSLNTLSVSLSSWSCSHCYLFCCTADVIVCCVSNKRTRKKYCRSLSRVFATWNQIPFASKSILLSFVKHRSFFFFFAWTKDWKITTK